MARPESGEGRWWWTAGRRVVSAARLARRFGGLWGQPDFVRLWCGQGISQLGSQFSALALPLTAVLLLDATAFEMGLLQAARSVPALLVGLVAGVWVDRLRRRPILVGTDLGRAALPADTVSTHLERIADAVAVRGGAAFVVR